MHLASLPTTRLPRVNIISWTCVVLRSSVFGGLGGLIPCPRAVSVRRRSFHCWEQHARYTMVEHIPILTSRGASPRPPPRLAHKGEMLPHKYPFLTIKCERPSASHGLSPIWRGSNQRSQYHKASWRRARFGALIDVYGRGPYSWDA